MSGNQILKSLHAAGMKVRYKRGMGCRPQVPNGCLIPVHISVVAELYFQNVLQQSHALMLFVAFLKLTTTCRSAKPQRTFFLHKSITI